MFVRRKRLVEWLWHFWLRHGYSKSFSKLPACPILWNFLRYYLCFDQQALL